MKVTGKCFILEHTFWGEGRDLLDGPTLKDTTVYASKKLLDSAVADIKRNYGRYREELTKYVADNFTEWQWSDTETGDTKAVLRIHKVPLVVELGD